MRSKGFTIVELLIVIVVIGILAALVISTFTSAQARARDTDRKNDLAIIAKALKLYSVDKENWIQAGSGCGYNGNGWSWINRGNNSPYATSIHDCLRSADYLQANVTDPSGGITASPTVGFAYMKLDCSTGEIFLLAKLETEPQSSTATDATICGASYDTTYGMNYHIRVK